MSLRNAFLKVMPFNHVQWMYAMRDMIVDFDQQNLLPASGVNKLCEDINVFFPRVTKGLERDQTKAQAATDRANPYKRFRARIDNPLPKYYQDIPDFLRDIALSEYSNSKEKEKIITTLGNMTTSTQTGTDNWIWQEKVCYHAARALINLNDEFLADSKIFGPDLGILLVEQLKNAVVYDPRAHLAATKSYEKILDRNAGKQSSVVIDLARSQPS